LAFAYAATRLAHKCGRCASIRIQRGWETVKATGVTARITLSERVTQCLTLITSNTTYQIRHSTFTHLFTNVYLSTLSLISHTLYKTNVLSVVRSASTFPLWGVALGLLASFLGLKPRTFALLQPVVQCAVDTRSLGTWLSTSIRDGYPTVRIDKV